MQQALLLGFVNRYFLPSLIWNTTTDSSSSSTSSIRLSSRSQGQQLKQGAPGFPSPGHIDQLWRGDPEAFPDQCLS